MTVPGRGITGTFAARTWEQHGEGLLSCHQFQQRVNAKLVPSAVLQDLVPMLFSPACKHLCKEGMSEGCWGQQPLHLPGSVLAQAAPNSPEL